VTSTLTVTPPLLTSLTLSTSSVAGGSSATGTVTLNGTSPTGGLIIGLSSSSSDASVPSSVTIAAGTTQATFTISTTVVQSTTTATITASQGTTVSKAAKLTIGASGLSGLSLNPISVVGGGTSTGTVTLSGPAPTGGSVVNLTSNSTNAVPPKSVTVQAGATSATFSVTTSVVASSISATITGTLGTTSKNATLNIGPLSLTSLSLNPTTVAGGNTSTGTIRLNGSAGAGGVVVSLSSSAASAASVPASVTIAAGQSSTAFVVTTTVVKAQVTANIKAIYQGLSQSVALTVNPATVLSVSLSPASLTGGANSTGTVTLTGPAPAGGLTVKLSSSSTKATVPPNVTVAAGKTTATFAVKSVVVATQTSVLIEATYGSVSENARLVITPASLVSLSVNPTSVVGLTGATGTVTLSGVASAGGMIVKLSSSNSAATVPASVTVDAGRSSATFKVKTVSVATQQLATLTASLNGTSQTATLTVNSPTIKSLTLNPTSVKGGKTSIGTVAIGTAAPTGGLIISLSSNSPSATVPASVTIPAGKTSITFTVKTTTVNAKTTVTLTAADGSSSKSAALTVT